MKIPISAFIVMIFAVVGGLALAYSAGVANGVVHGRDEICLFVCQLDGEETGRSMILDKDPHCVCRTGTQEVAWP